MQSQQEQNIVASATDQDHVQSPGKAKGVVSKVKHKARKLKDKVKKVTHSGNKAHDENKHGHLGDRDRGLHPTLAHERKEASSDEYDSEEQGDDLDDSQMKYERLPSLGSVDKQGDGSDIELHNGVPANAAGRGSYWKSVDDDSPLSIYKSAGPSDALQATPTEYHNYAANNDDQSLKEFSGKEIDVTNPDDPNHVTHDQIGVYSEDLSADRKLGIGIPSDRHSDSEDTTTSSGDIDKHVEHESPTPDSVDGDHEQLYRPVEEPDDFRASLPSEPINASLYGDVLAAEDKLNKSARTDDDYPSDQSEEEFSFDKQNSLYKQPEMLGPEQKDVAATQDKALVEDGGEGQEASTSTEGWGKWSAEKLNNAVDSLALKVAGEGKPEDHEVVGENDRYIDREASDVSYYDPNDLQNNTFQEQFTLGSGGIADEEDTVLLDSAVAGSVAVVGKLTELRDSIASTLGISGNETRDDVPHADSDEHSGKEQSLNSNGREGRKSGKDEDDQQQTGFLQGLLKETMGSAFGVVNVSPQPELTSDKKPHRAGTNSNVESRESGRLSHEGSLDSASDVPQAAFL